MEKLAKKILVVEDNESIGKILVTKLNENGYITKLETTGREGLETALKDKPDLTILDIELPLLNGLDVLQELRKDDWGKQAKILIMTNSTEDLKMQRALDNGVWEYLVKANWDLADVIERIHTILAN